MVGVDLGSLYPESLKPAFITAIREFYITTYADRFFSSPPAWFNMYVWVELIYHLPLSFWAIGALVRGELMKAESKLKDFGTSVPGLVLCYVMLMLFRSR